MEIKGKVQSYNKSTNVDCFDLGGPNTIDHIWPKSKGGSNGKANQQLLSVKANRQKADSTKDEVNGIRFSILKKTSKDQETYGVMFIEKNGNWYEVIPTK